MTKKVSDLTIGKRIRELRVDSKLSQKELAMKLGYTNTFCDRYVSKFECGTRMPNKEEVKKLAVILETTADYILTGKKNEPQPVKKELTNHEGYIDPTAAKAVAIVMNDKKEKEKEKDEVIPSVNPHPGEVYEAVGCTTPLLILGVAEDNVFATNVYYRPGKNLETFIIDDDYRYINPNRMFTRRISDLIAPDRVCDLMLPSDFDCLMLKYAKKLGFAQKPEVAMDQTSIIFGESVQYFNKKFGMDIEIPDGVVSLETAISISNEMNIKLEELVKDHTEDRVLDEICKIEDEMKSLEDKKRELQKMIGLSN